MTTDLDLDTFLTTVYCVVDELYVERFGPQKPARPGVRPEMADSEVLTVLALAQWQPRRSERAFVRYVARHWQAYFPRMLSQSAFNRRARDLMPVLCALGPAVAERVTASWSGVAYEAVDGVPVPLLRWCRGRRRKLFTREEAGLGRGGSDRARYYGVHLVGAVHPAGVITGFVVGPPDTSERWLADTLFRWRRDPTAPVPTAPELAPLLGPRHCRGGQRRGPTGPLRPRTGAGRPAQGPYLVDLGLAGAAWQAHWRASYGATVLTKADLPQDLTPRQREALVHCACRHRQPVETAFGWLTDLLGLAFPRARTIPGLLARLGAKVAAFNLGVYVNHLCGRAPLAFFNPLA